MTEGPTSARAGEGRRWWLAAGAVVLALAAGFGLRARLWPAAPCVAVDTPGDFDPACDRDPSVSEGPGSTRLRIAVTDDQGGWRPLPETLVHQGGVPSCITVGDTLHVFFVGYRDADGNVFDSTVHARTRDLKSWRFDAVRPDHTPEGFRRDLLDPTVLPVGDGFVLLATQGALGHPAGGTPTAAGSKPAAIFRYSSADLEAWTSDGGPFWADPERKILDSTGFRTAQGDYLLLASGDLKRGHFSARWAPDQSSATPGDRIVATDRGATIKLTNCAPGGDCVGYTNQPPFALRAAHVSDAGEVTVAPEPLLTAADDPHSGGVVADPAICPLPDGSGEVMVYVSGY